jgi:hypothetical protein
MLPCGSSVAKAPTEAAEPSLTFPASAGYLPRPRLRPHDQKSEKEESDLDAHWPLPLPETEPNPLAPSSGGRHAGLGPGGGRSFQAITPPYEELYSCPCRPSLSLISFARQGGRGTETSPSRPDSRAQIYPHSTPPRDLVVHEVQASPPQGSPLLTLGGGLGRRSRWSR